MKPFANQIFNSILIVMILILVGCASVPKEVVELSYTVGQDLDTVHFSYKELIHTYFDNLRIQTIIFLETSWIPAFLKDYIQTGELVKIARDSDPTSVLEGVQDWVEFALENIETKKRELIDPINSDEVALLKIVDEAFSNLIRANATITAHLNSLRKIQEVQDDALKALNLKELRDKINKALTGASDRAKKALEDLKIG